MNFFCTTAILLVASYSGIANMVTIETSPQELSEFMVNSEYVFKEIPQGKELCVAPSSFKEPEDNEVYRSLNQVLADSPNISEFYDQSLEKMSQMTLNEDVEIEQLQMMTDVCCLVLRAPLYVYDVEDLSRLPHMDSSRRDIEGKDASLSLLKEIINHLKKYEGGEESRALLKFINEQLIDCNRNLRQAYQKRKNEDALNVEKYNSYGGRYYMPSKLYHKYIPEKYFTRGELIGAKVSEYSLFLETRYRSNVFDRQSKTKNMARLITDGSMPAQMRVLMALYPKNEKKIIADIRAAGYPSDQDVADFLNYTCYYADDTKFLFKGGVWQAYKKTNLKDEHIISNNKRL